MSTKPRGCSTHSLIESPVCWVLCKASCLAPTYTTSSDAWRCQGDPALLCGGPRPSGSLPGPSPPSSTHSIPCSSDSTNQFPLLAKTVVWGKHCLETKVNSRNLGGFPGGSDGKESACHSGDLGSIPGSGRSPGGGPGNPLQYSCLENPHGQRSLAGSSLRSHRESDTIEQLSTETLE